MMEGSGQSEATDYLQTQRMSTTIPEGKKREQRPGQCSWHVEDWSDSRNDRMS